MIAAANFGELPMQASSLVGGLKWVKFRAGVSPRAAWGPA